MYGKIEYNEKGKPMCEVCRKHFDRVIKHVVAAHGLSPADYKKMFGLDPRKGICSHHSAEKSRQAVRDNPSVIQKNFLEKGAKYRFKAKTIKK